MEATQDIEELLPLLVVPTRREVGQFLVDFGQAWFNGRRSLRTWANPDIAFPFWIITYWREILDASEAKDRWIAATAWLEVGGKTEEELMQKRTVQNLWRVIGWHGSVCGIAGVTVSDLADYFSKAYLRGNLVNAMLDLLSIRLKAVGRRRSDATVIANTTFARFIELLRPRNDGMTPITSNPGAQKYLSKYGTWFRNGDRTELHFVLYRPPNHWTACSIDFEGDHICYGDGLKWERPKDFFLALDDWSADNFPDKEFRVTDDLPCAVQTDGYNCPIISVNTVAHNFFGDPLWTRKAADTMRMKAFCDIVNHSLSAMVRFFSRPSE
jgi:hypothetical protein